MKRITLAMVMAPAFALGAQTPPARPTPAQPPAPATAPTPRAPRQPEMVWAPDEARVDEMRRRAEEMRATMDERTHELQNHARELHERVRADQEITQERMREQQERMRESSERLREEMQIAQERARIDHERVSYNGRGELPIAPMAPMAPMAPLAALAPMAPLPPVWSGVPAGVTPDAYVPDALDGRFLNRKMPPAWAQGDPADSMYRIAREALNRGEWRRAADTCAEVSRRFPSSQYSPNCLYWEAFARYRIGTTEQLRLATRALESITSKNYQLSKEADVNGLRARIDGALALRGDVPAEVRIRDAVRRGGSGGGDGENAQQTCDREDLQVRAEALNALVAMDQNAALPTVRRVLDRRDECSVPLRKNAVMILARRADTSSTTLLVGVARNDPSYDVRTDAIMYLPRMPGDLGVNALEDILRNSDDERIQRAAVSALMGSESPRARQSTRALLERKDASEQLKMESLQRFSKERSSPEDVAFLRNYYTRTESERLKEATIRALARIGGSESESYLMGIVRNEDEPSSMRAAALGWLSQNGNVSIVDLGKLYDVSDSRNMRDRIISALANRKETEATDKLIEIAKSSTDYNVRRQVINILMRRNDPKSAAALKELVEK